MTASWKLTPLDTMTTYQATLDEAAKRFDAAVCRFPPSELSPMEIGTGERVERGVAQIRGLPHVEIDEILQFEGGYRGYAFNLDRNAVGCVLLDSSDQITAGTRVRRMHLARTPIHCPSFYHSYSMTIATDIPNVGIVSRRRTGLVFEDHRSGRVRPVSAWLC